MGRNGTQQKVTARRTNIDSLFVKVGTGNSCQPDFTPERGATSDPFLGLPVASWL